MDFCIEYKAKMGFRENLTIKKKAAMNAADLKLTYF